MLLHNLTGTASYRIAIDLFRINTKTELKKEININKSKKESFYVEDEKNKV